MSSLGYIVACCLVVIGFALHHLLADPVKGTIYTRTASTASRPTPVRWVNVTTPYLSFSVPGDFKSTPVDPPVAPTLAGYTYDTETPPVQSLSIQIRQLESNSLSSDAGFAYYARSTDLFQQQSLDAGGISGQFFTAIQPPYAQVVFMQHANIMASIYLSGDGSEEMTTMSPTLRQIIASIDWR